MLDPQKLKKDIISDIRVELSEEFDRNFNRKAFFTNKWKRRRNPAALGSLLVVTGTLRRSIKATEKPTGVRFSSAVPYATVHNEGGKGRVTVRSHTRSRKGRSHTVKQHQRRVNIPQRQFIGDGPDTKRLIGKVVADNVKLYNQQLTKALKQKK